MGVIFGRAAKLLGSLLILGSAVPAAAIDAPSSRPAATTALRAAPARPAPAASKYAAILVDAGTREILYANGANLIRHPASITKIMTLFLAFDELDAGRLKLTDRVPISHFAASQRPSKLGLAPGKSISVEDAIRVIAVKSANDIAVALAEKIGGTEANFAAMMTRRARSLGMRDTLFVNASGLPNKRHVTTARDLAVMSLALIRAHPRNYAYFSQQKFAYEKRVMANHNKLLGKLPGMDGIKTGYTVDAGFTLAASAMRNGRRLVAVVLGEPSLAARDRDVTALLNAGFTVLDSRSAGRPITVTAALTPVDHPALRGLPTVEQGSLDPTSLNGPTSSLGPTSIRDPGFAETWRRYLTRETK
jgi:D-alanyl-D-alanine carboxypeptidase